MIEKAIRFARPVSALVVIGAVMVTSPFDVKGQEAEEAAARKQIEDILHRAEELREDGAAEKAEQLVKKAQALKARLAKASGEGREKKKIHEELEGILHALNHGAAALRALDRVDEAERLEALAADLQKKAGAGKRRGTGSEREVAVHQIEVMNAALAALREGERKDAAELLKRAIQARQVRAKRLKGEEAHIVLEREPKLANTVEVLGLASKLWREFGDKEKAAAVGQLAERLWAHREGADKERRKEYEGHARLKRLEDELAELEAALERNRAQLEELKQELDR